MSNAKSKSATPTPLKQKNFQIVDANGGEWNLIPHYPDERGEAENKYAAEVLLPLIVRAVNSYDALKKSNGELLAVVKSMRLYIDTFSAEAKNLFRAGGNGEYVDGLIAKAEGSQTREEK